MVYCHTATGFVRFKVMPLLSTYQIGEKIGCSASTVGRAAARAGVGVRNGEGRLLAIDSADLEKVKAAIRGVAGNPVWIAAAKKKAAKKTAPSHSKK